MSEVEDAFFAADPNSGETDDVFGSPGELAHEPFSGRRFLKVVVLGVWGVGLLVAATLRWDSTRFTVPGVGRWVLLASAAALLVAAGVLSGSVRETYVPSADEDPVFTELQSGFRERYQAGAGDLAWAVTALAPLLALFMM